MAPPWVVFDSASGGSCSHGSDPDIAGVGVVISFVLAGIMTTTASIFVMVLDQAYHEKGHFAWNSPISYIRDRFLDTEWKRDYAWRPFLDPLIISLGDQQLVTGYGFLLSGWIKVAQSSISVSSAHFVLILYICALSSSSHLAALITLRKYFRKHVLLARIRLALSITFTAWLFASMITAIASHPSPGDHPTAAADDRGPDVNSIQRARRMAFLIPMALMLLGFSTALACILYAPCSSSTCSPTHAHAPAALLKRRSSLSGKSLVSLVKKIADAAPSPRATMRIPASVALRLLYCLFLNPLIAFAVQILLAVLSVVLVMSQKFSRPPPPPVLVGDGEEGWCGLQDERENGWGFGQTLSLVMLALPGMSAAQAYFEGRREIRGDGD
ncbi:hypothetical protein BS50DRAFT_592508 [Corynespora cassiicola Philippines]|uniref:Uncharacterized protein n=1 Tax=Corynespora cassiicola Philippines TaxID=1448308 RepID=A0A2T2NA59_CORCC|nr:hypothetical protein BS50DRAFT_592508 [Corynespora cassiicola Philippines]